MRRLCGWVHLQIRAGLGSMFTVFNGSLWQLADTVSVYSLQRLHVPGVCWEVHWTDSCCGLCVYSM